MMNKPNILLITTDQQRYDTINAAGNPHILTPNLNWLCDSGVRFTRAYSDCPVCMPARTTILNGRHGHTTGLTDNCDGLDPIDPATSTTGLLTRAGYQTRLVGKTHWPKFRVNYGFEHVEPCDDYFRYMRRHPEKGVPMDHGLGQNQMEPVISTVSESNSLTHWIVDRSVDFLETRDPSRPFFLWTSFTKPHPPFDCDIHYWNLYQNRTMPDPVYGDWSQKPEDVPEGFMRFIKSLNSCDRFSPEMLRDMRRAYYACITQIDYNLGRLFARLRELGQLENTWIVFTSDHGELLGDHFLAAKFLALEASAKVPFIIRAPGNGEWKHLRGTCSDKLVTLADLLPTFAGIGGADEVPADIDGRDIRNLVSDEAVSREELRFQASEFHGLLSGTWKYLLASSTGDELLFNLADDPLEQKNLIGQRPNDHKSLRARLLQLMEQSGLPSVKNGTLNPSGPPTFGNRRGDWPGHHSIEVPSDTLH
jgi:arylsulfatase A-like enzyme